MGKAEVPLWEERSAAGAGRPVRLPLAIKIMLLTTVCTLFALGVTGFFTYRTVTDALKDQVGKGALGISQAVAEMPAIRQNLGQPDGWKVIQPIADRIRKTTGATVVVVFDRYGIRYSHPIPSRIGKHIVGGDEGGVYEGKSYVSEAVGTLGPQIRGFVPVYSPEDDGEIIGGVVTTLLIPNVVKAITPTINQIELALALGLLAGIAGSFFLARVVKRDLYGLEPETIGKMFYEREAILESTREGILAIDAKGRVTLINREARRMLSIGGEVLGKDINDILPGSVLARMLKARRAEYDKELRVGSGYFMVNVVNIRIGDETRGALATLRDRTDVRRMAEELTGVKKYVEGLRAQSHEYLNRLHAVAGLIQLGEREKALRYIEKVAGTRGIVVNRILKSIKSSGVAGLLIGKYGRAQEFGIHIELDDRSFLSEDIGEVMEDSLVAVLGNLLDNAIEALGESDRPEKEIRVSILEREMDIELVVEDNGPGIPKAFLPKVMSRGFTTKGEGHAGLGLAIIREKVELLAGTINYQPLPVGGRFLVRLPKKATP